MTHPKLGEHLIGEGKLRPEQLARALETQKLVGGRLGTNLLELGMVEEGTLLRALGDLRATKTVDATELRATQPEVVRMIPAKLAMRYKLVPFVVKGKTIFIASKDPGDPLQEDEISFLTACMVRTCIATELRLEIALRRFYNVPVDRRFLILGKRLAGGGAPAPPSSSPHAATRSGPPAADVPRRATRPAPPTVTAARVVYAKPAAEAAPSEPQFIELDDDDLALLRRPSEEGPETEAPMLVMPDVEPGAEAVGEDLEAAEAEAWLEAVAAEVAEDADEDLDIEARLLRASMALQEAEIRDEIGDALLRFAGAYYRRRALLISRRDRVFGWMGDGEGVSTEAVRGVDLDSSQPSVFFGLKEASSFWLGPLPPLPANRQLSDALGEPPKNCLVLPVTLRGKVVCYLYVDNLDEGVSGTPVAEMKRLVAKAGIAFEVYILKNKIRVL